ncbi:RNA polymerase sigma factor [Pseudomonas synxantha]|uniref:ECF family sigma factor n=1 Tax=Pseudomonas synxantha TaxID=47883 RepID=A0AAX3IE69_9PSED|nr:RNA polymerase sigma factor [Pseudomonas synxantha]AZE69460.1 Sigma factor, ECF subfamily [Pseudomonas synxantha]KRP51074.1 RNA polymerase sigma70 [Pseudomonas synxantha]MBI6564854.1 RNA polymerase sigma factor [Pseudomonas synxantha]MBI6581401.1 RNA polymerase sigma factor [Pseudomonas synxantha]MBI6641902.1 RNA polymerase sigma factor [Pseudomonas synxantha]
MSDVDLKGLFLKHADTLRGYLARKVRDPQLAADLVQESFLRLAQKPAGERIDNSQGYLYRTASNLLIDHIRQEARRKTDTVPHEALAEIEDDVAGLEAQAMAQQQRQALKQALAELPERTQQIFRLNRIEGMTHAQVAQHLDISDSSVQKHLAKALAYVMQRLQEDEVKPSDE